MNSRSEVLVIGGGVIGLCVARELQLSGKNVTLIDRSSVGRGCSYANAGWITPCFAMPLPQPGMLIKSLRWTLDSSSPLHIQPQWSLHWVYWLLRFLRAMNRAQMLRSIEALTNLSTYSLDFYSKLQPKSLSFERKGLLMVSATPSGIKAMRSEMNLMSDRGILGRFLSSDELRSFEPTLKPLVRGGVFYPNEAQIDPFGTSRALAQDFENAGGKIFENTEVFDFEISGKKIQSVRTTQGEFDADLVILAAGSWSHELGKCLGLKVPILGGKGYSMTLENVSKKPSHSIMIVDRKIAVTPFPDRLRIAGTLELVNQDFTISIPRLQSIYHGAHEYLQFSEQNPSGGFDAKDVWRGLRPCTPDGVPLIGYSRKIENLFYCTGHQMLGLQTAPGTAKVATDLILGNPPLTPTKVFDPKRFE